MTQYFLQQGTYSKYVTAHRLATHLLAIYQFDEGGINLAIRIYPFQILTNVQATTQWVITEMENGAYDENEVVTFLCNQLEKSYGLTIDSDIPHDGDRHEYH